MNTINFLEQLASNVHHKVDLAHTLLKQPESIQLAYQTNANRLIRNYLSNDLFFSDTCTILER